MLWLLALLPLARGLDDDAVKVDEATWALYKQCSFQFTATQLVATSIFPSHLPLG